MRQKKIKKEYLKYVLVDKTTYKVEIHRYKTVIADKIGISTRTLDRNMPYESEKYLVYRVNVVFI